ncbi:MAG: LemA family protein [Trueperaceae bacterium]|jgi:LemA protein|nr:LemA family protein [Truepera sp.]HRN18660.1 LemA family protein [Trueperaceae bacterium]HRQ10333.1 LemA family protein [Trueperaceae bacterium]
MGSLIVLIVLVALGVYAVSIYNRIVAYEKRYQNAWSQIDVQLKRRSDLIPNLVETVKGYAAHESQVFEEVTRARASLMNAKTVNESADAANVMTAALGKLFAVAEAYPDLKANENFKMLQEELSGVENKIAYARQFYNDAVMQYNTLIETVPAVFLAGPMNKKAAVFLQIPEGDREVPQVSFGAAPQAGA